MVSIGLLSDTHGYLDSKILKHFELCDEIWHAGDFGSTELLQTLQQYKPLRSVWGNIDAPTICQQMPEYNLFNLENVQVAMVHIGGYPGRYAKGVKQWLKQSKANLFISGHSHILKVMPDEELNLLHLNPGAAGKQGWHKVRTAMRFKLHDGRVKDLEIIELGDKIVRID